MSMVVEHADFPELVLDGTRLDPPGPPQDEQAARGVLVTTSRHGRSSRETAHRNGRCLDLVDGRNPTALRLEHLGIDALIGLPELPPRRQSGDVT
ncbi:hypothetical protein [Kitasatospora phosalacinea]|nr:hypothetical protein [Kitasatospora phosalacinea]